MTATTEAAPRIVTLDIVRGVAVMGILAMNIIAFAMPMGAYMNPIAYGGAAGADLGAWLVNFIFVDGKMRGLFSFLFGASMLLVIQAAAAKGSSPAYVHYSRMFWLLVFGLLHLYFIWWGDILHHYALIGAIAYFFRDKPVKSLIKWAIGLLIVQALVMTGFGFSVIAASAAAAAPGATAETIAQWQEIKASFGPLSAAKLAEDLALFRGSYDGIVAHRLDEMLWQPLIGIPQFGWETLAYMLLGMAGFKSGFLTGAWEDRRYRQWALTGYALSVPAYAAAAAVILDARFDVVTTAIVGFMVPTLFRPLMIVGLAALIILLTRRGGALATRIAATGRAAFTNYLGTSIIVSTFFYGYGGGYYGHLSRAECYLVVAAMWLLMLAWSKPWLDRNQYGPFEWLWRSLARRKVQPMKRRPAVATAPAE